MKQLPTILFSMILLAGSPPTAHAAPALSDPETLGFQAGAMEYCRDNFTSDNKVKKQYDALRSAYMKDFEQLSGGDKQRALEVAAMVGKKGNIGGKKLSESRCDQLRRSALREQSKGQ